MPLNTQQIEELLRLIKSTQDDELNCDQCVAPIAEFAERELASKSVREGLRAVEHHLSICSECREEYEALQRALEVMND